MRKITLLLAAVAFSIIGAYAQQAKYVFYFIGDGMGVNQVQGTELYRGELEGKIGITPILFTQFPYATVATTFSATNGVTDSAAAGTALATGNKTKNGAIGVLKDLETPVNSIAVWAKNAGYRVGVATSVSVDHATPAAFYAHAGSRSSYYNIGKDLYEAGFDFYAGSDFLDPTDKGKSESLYDMAEKNGYTIARGYKDYMKKCKKAEKMILFQPELRRLRLTAAVFRMPLTARKRISACRTSPARPSTSSQKIRTKGSSSWWKAEKSTGLAMQTMQLLLSTK